jgi:hypothetical protein
MTDEDPWEKWLSVYDEHARLIRLRKFGEASNYLRSQRQRAVDLGETEQASALSGLLATTLTMESRDEEALQESEMGERLDPTRPEAKLDTARILLHFLNRPAEARSKAEEAISAMPVGHGSHYAALAALGLARARTDDLEGALEIFREMTSASTLNELAAAEYIGAYDFALLEELAKAGVGKVECRKYLAVVSEVPNDWPHIEAQLERIRLLLNGA